MGFFFLYGLKEVATPSISRCNISLRNLFPHYKMYFSFSLVPPLIKESSLSITLQLLLILHETHSIAGSSGLMYATSSKFIPYDVANVKFKFSSFLFSLSIWYHVYKKWKLKGFKKLTILRNVLKVLGQGVKPWNIIVCSEILRAVYTMGMVV